MNNKLEIEGYFSEKEIIKILCRKRAIAAKKGHDEHFLRNISTKAYSPHKNKVKDIFQYFPARSKWIRINKTEREARDTNSVQINAVQLERTVWREIKKYKAYPSLKPIWLLKLEGFIIEIQESVFKKELGYQILKPKIFPVLKDKKENSYRPIALFTLKDLIVTGQIAKYLTYCFDPLFSKSSYAFRTAGSTQGTFNHHKAIEDIIDFKNEMNSSLYVSECDIKKFFDCVNHAIITEKFYEIIKETEEKLGFQINPIAIHFFHSYLDSFSFNENIKKVETKLLSSYGIHNGSIPWVKESELEGVGSNINIDKIGVPQGGAISCLIANIILNHVDKIVNLKADENTYYGRFCDDMILMHTNEERCENLFQIYQTALQEVKLISHKPIEFKTYGKGFWHESLKSKSPYKWDSFCISSKEKNVPWLSFVGYQICYDGNVRVRKKSIAKELKKQVLETDKIIKLIRNGKKPSINKKAIKFRLQQRLISMAIGRFRFGPSKISMCWCAGFKVLKSNSNISTQIKNLDRNREKQINRLQLFLTKIKTPLRKSKKKITPLKYYGCNYSYNKQFR